MTEFEVRIPYRDRDDLTVEVVDAARETMDDEFAVVQKSLPSAPPSRCDLSWPAAGRNPSADPAEQRQIVDKAREDVSASEASARLGAPAHRRGHSGRSPATRSEPRRDQGGKAIQECAEPSCEVISPVDGTIAPVAAKKWWCQTHEANAADGDLDDWVAPGVGSARQVRR